MRSLKQDLTNAVRALTKRPAFSFLVVLTLALGIGANSAIFSVVNGVLLKPLPYERPGELAMIWSRWNNFDKTWVSEAEYLDYQRQDAFQDVALWDCCGEATLTGTGAPESVTDANVTANTLSVLGAKPLLGRMFTAEEDVPNGPQVAMLGYGLWQRRYGGDPSVLGRTIVVDGIPAAVVGVLPEGFRLPLEFQSAEPAQIYRPLRVDRASPSRGSHGFYAVARLAPGVTAAQASATVGTMARRWTEEGLYRESMQFSPFVLSLEEEVTGDVSTPLVILLASVGLLLLITCVNVANIMLTRADGRRREIAVRAALGADRRHLLRLVLTEALLVGLAGGVVGLLLAWGGVELLSATAPTIIPRAGMLSLDGTVLGFTLLAALSSGVLVGAVPALRLSRINLVGALKDGGGGSDSGRRRQGRSLLIAAEMALTVVLVIGAGLLVRSFVNILNVDPGLDPHNVLTLRLSLPASDYPENADLVRFYQQLRDEVVQIPGVEAAGIVRRLPLADDIGDAGFAIQDRPVAEEEQGRSADWQVAGPGYFEAMGMRVVAGRFFDESDRSDGAPVILLNETLVREYFGDETPIGKQVRAGGGRSNWRTVIGIVGDVRHHGLTRPVKRKWYVPHSQFGDVFGITRRTMYLTVKTAGDPHAPLPAIERLVHARDPNLPLTRVRTMEDVMGAAVKEQRFTTALMAGFAILALVLAAVGVYGVIAFAVSRRTQEIGIRLALGADRGMVRRLVVRQGMAPALAGVAIGLVVAAGVSRLMASVLYAVSPLDPLTFATMPAALALVALAATIIPAQRATRVEPVRALKYE